MGVDSGRLAQKVWAGEMLVIGDLGAHETFGAVGRIVDLLYEAIAAGGNLHVCGVGKSGFVAQKMAATLKSFGVPAFHLNALDAFHGDVGCIRDADVLLLLSKSGETAECLELAKLNTPVVAITCNGESTLAKLARESLVVPVSSEVDLFNKAPTSSTTAMMVACDMIAVCLAEKEGATLESFLRAHPKGEIGKSLGTNEVPVYLLCYEKHEYLEALVDEIDRTVKAPPTPFPVHVWDDGSTNDEMVAALCGLDESRYIVHRERHKGYREQFIAIGQHARASGHQFYLYVEDDSVFCVNWYQYGVKKLRELVGAGLKVGVLALYTGHPALQHQVVPNVYRNRNEHFYGTCALILNSDLIGPIAKSIREENLNPDIAMLRMLGHQDHEYGLYEIVPTLAQHVGKETRLNAPMHQSGKFLGREKDALEVMA